MKRRGFLRLLGGLALAAVAGLPGTGSAGPVTDIRALKSGYAARLNRLLSEGWLPYIDIESSCNPRETEIDSLAREMDRRGIGLMALSADIGKDEYAEGVRYDELSDRLIRAWPDRFIPVGNGGQPPALTEFPEEFLNAQENAARQGRIALFGEFEMRHYPSPRQLKRKARHRDVYVPLDGPVGEGVFSMSQRTGLPVQLHYEIENELLGPLERMLEKYPGARIIWCHLAQVRYIERASEYSAAYVDGLLRRFPNLWLDTAFGDADSVYPASGQRHARIWTVHGNIRDEWLELFAAWPDRFLSALDLGGDRMNQLPDYDRRHRSFLDKLPKDIRHKVAYRNSWKLLFNEEFD